MTIDYLFRQPIFPIICIIDDVLITAKSGAALDLRLNNVTLTPDTRGIFSQCKYPRMNQVEMFITNLFKETRAKIQSVIVDCGCFYQPASAIRVERVIVPAATLNPQGSQSFWQYRR